MDKNNNKKRIMKYFIGLVIAVIGYSLYSSPSHDPRSRIVRITHNNGMCSGEQVLAPSGQSYIMSAGHCRSLSTNDVFTIETEDHRTLQRKLVAEDPKSDLIIIEGIPNMVGIPIAKFAQARDKVRTLTHGSNMDTYETSGVLIQVSKISAMLSEIKGQADEDVCASQPKTYVEDSLLGRICVMSVFEMISTAQIVPGSSGGAVLNMDNELVGIASASRGDSFSAFVLLSDIQAFISNY